MTVASREDAAGEAEDGDAMSTLGMSGIERRRCRG
jgi:hypothetical protein